MEDEEEKIGNFSFMIPYALIGNLNGTIEQYKSLNLDNVFEEYPWLFWVLLVGLAAFAIFLIVVTIYCISKNKKKVIKRESEGFSGLYGDGLSDIEFAGRKLLKFVAKRVKRKRSSAPHAPQINEYSGDEKLHAYRFPEQNLHFAVPPQAVSGGVTDLKFDHLGTEVTQIVGVPMLKVAEGDRRPLPEVNLDEFENEPFPEEMPSDDIEEGTVRVVRRQRRMELRLKRLFADGERCRSVEVRTPDLLNREDPLVRTIGDTMWMNSPHYSEAALEVFNGGYDPVLHAAQPKIESFFDVAYSHFEGTIVDKTNLTMVNPGIVGKYDILLTDPTTNQLRAFYVFHGMAPPGSFNERLRVRMTVNALFRCICTEDPALCMAERGDLLTPEVFEEFRDVYPKLKQMYDRLMDEIELQRERLEREEEQMQQLAEFLQRNPWIAFIVRRLRIITLLALNFIF